MEEGLLIFEEIDTQLHTPDLFSFVPTSWQYVGKIIKQYHEKTVACFYLAIDELNVGEEIVIQNGNTYFKQELKEMKVNEQEATIAKKGEPISILLDKPVLMSANIYAIKRN